MVENRKKRLAEFKSRHQFWSNDEVKILIDLWLQDVPAAYISKVLKRSGNAIEVKALRLGLAPRRSERKLVHNAKGQKARVRPCLNCKTLFFSIGIGNRICANCKEHPSWQSGTDLHLNFEEFNLD
ncbi:MAG: hypothetical protein OXH47_09170 [Paracoccaceae bacterium]|nr:hypothetical protein [Paracoccaceae bacterium]